MAVVAAGRRSSGLEGLAVSLGAGSAAAARGASEASAGRKAAGGAQGARCLTWSTRRAGAGASTPSWQVAPRLQGIGGGEESEEPATAIRAAGRPGRG